MLKHYFKSLHLAEMLKDESGQDSVEYAILIGIVATGLITTVNGIATQISTKFASLSTAL